MSTSLAATDSTRAEIDIRIYKIKIVFNDDLDVSPEGNKTRSDQWHERANSMRTKIYQGFDVLYFESNHLTNDL